MKNLLLQYARGVSDNQDIELWIERRWKQGKLIDQGEVEHIIDYFCSDEAPKRFLRMSYKNALQKSKDWIKKLQKKAKDIQEAEDDTEVVLDFGDGYKIVKLIGENAYKREGLLMRHCVSSYYGKDDDIYSLRDENNKPHCTMSKNSEQVKGKGNGSVHPKYINYILDFLEFLEIPVRENAMKNLGYKKVQFAEYCTNKLFKNEYLPEKEKIIYNDKIKIFNDLKKLKKYKGKKARGYRGYLDLRGTNITSLPEGLEVGENLYLQGTKITSLPEGLKVGGSLYLQRTKITSLPEGLKVGGSLYLQETKITSLPKGMKIWGRHKDI